MSLFGSLVSRGSAWLDKVVESDYSRQFTVLQQCLTGAKSMCVYVVYVILAGRSVRTTVTQATTSLTECLLQEDDAVHKDETGPCIEMLLQNNAMAMLCNAIITDVCHSVVRCNGTRSQLVFVMYCWTLYASYLLT